MVGRVCLVCKKNITNKQRFEYVRGGYTHSECIEEKIEDEKLVVLTWRFQKTR
jgi:hypothetical protein